MYRSLTKFIVALLVLLGDCALTTTLTSEYRNTTDNYSPQLSQSEQTDTYKLNPRSPSPYALTNNTLATQSALHYALTITLSTTHTHQHNYSLFSARAPPANYQLI